MDFATYIMTAAILAFVGFVFMEVVDIKRILSRIEKKLEED